MVARVHSNEDGFSLSELIVVLSLLGVILAATYGGLQAVTSSRDVSDRQALFAREVSTPLNAMEEALTQALSFESIGPYAATFLTDRDNDNVIERHQIDCTTGGVVTHRTWNTNVLRQNLTPPVFDGVWSEANVNRANSQPMFEFMDEDEDPTLDTGEAQSVRVTLMVEYDGRGYEDSRRIFMRNR